MGLTLYQLLPGIGISILWVATIALGLRSLQNISYIPTFLIVGGILLDSETRYRGYPETYILVGFGITLIGGLSLTIQTYRQFTKKPPQEKP